MIPADRSGQALLDTYRSADLYVRLTSRTPPVLNVVRACLRLTSPIIDLRDTSLQLRLRVVKQLFKRQFQSKFSVGRATARTPVGPNSWRCTDNAETSNHALDARLTLTARCRRWISVFNDAGDRHRGNRQVGKLAYFMHSSTVATVCWIMPSWILISIHTLPWKPDRRTLGRSFFRISSKCFNWAQFARCRSSWFTAMRISPATERNGRCSPHNASTHRAWRLALVVGSHKEPADPTTWAFLRGGLEHFHWLRKDAPGTSANSVPRSRRITFSASTSPAAQPLESQLHSAGPEVTAARCEHSQGVHDCPRGCPANASSAVICK